MSLLSFADRLGFAMKAAGVNQPMLAKAIGVSKSAINQILHGATKGMKPEHLVRTSRFLHVRTEWLVMGEEPMRLEVIPENDRALLEQYQTLPIHQRETVAHVVRDLASTHYPSKAT